MRSVGGVFDPSYISRLINPEILLGGFQGGVGRGFMCSVCVVGIHVGECVDGETEKENLTVLMLRDLSLVWEFLAHVTAGPAIFPLLG